MEKSVNNKKEERSSSLTLTRGEDLTPRLLTKLREESLHSTSPKEALMSAISASFQDLSQLGETEGGSNEDEEGLGLAPELVVEVNCVLSKLMNSLNENLDPELIPTIKDLQATLNSKKKRVELESRFRRQCPPIDNSTSKVPWKIRAARKRAIKHHTTGMTKDEFLLIKNSLQESAKSFTSIPTTGYALSRNKSESAIRTHQNVIPGNLRDSQPFHSNNSSSALGSSSDQKTRTLPLVDSSNGSDLKASDIGYASDVCDYNISTSSSSCDPTALTPKDPKKEPSSTLQSNEKLSRTTEKPPRRSVKSSGSGSAVKARIDRRKRMRHANAIDNPHGSLSDQESSMVEDNDEEEDEEELKANGGSSEETGNPSNAANSSSSELTPETNRRKNWNSRFSNIKNAFVSEEEIFQKSRSPSINRDSSMNNPPSRGGGKKADENNNSKYMNIVVQARLENNRSRRNLSRSNSKGSSSDKKSASSQNLSTSSVSSSKSKQPTPNRDPAPKSPPRLSKSLPKESRAEAMGLEPSNKNRNDMDYAEYMNIISRVRRSKESTRVRTEQVRLASMYAQEQRRQEEIKREEERLKLEREKFQKDLERQKMEELESRQKAKESSTPSPAPTGQKVTISPPPPSKEDTQSAAVTAASQPSPIKSTSPNPLSSETVQSDFYERSLTQLKEQVRLDKMSEEQKRQQELREEQVKAEQEKLERLRQEQIRQEKEREEIHRLEYERLRQIQEEQRKLDEERRRQQERIRLEQVRLEEERKRQETLQAERNAEYNRQRLDMEAQNVCLPQETRAKLLMSPTASAPLVSLASSTPNQFSGEHQLSPEEKIIQKRLSDQETLRKCHKAEESKIRQEKLKLIQQEEMLISRQEEMLRQVEAERQNLLKQEQLIRSRQQGRLTQVRQEKMLLEKQEEMLQMRERQLIVERVRQKKLRLEQKSLREQEEVIRKRQEQISKELMGEISPVIEQASPPPVSDKVSPILGVACFPTVSQSSESGVHINGEEDEEEDTLDEESSEAEEFYESTVEVKQKSTSVPTSVRTVGLANTDKPWAPITPYLSTYDRTHPNSNPTPPSEMFMDDEKETLFKSGIITSPESLRTSSTLITTPDETSLQLSLDGSTPPSVPPLPYDEAFRPLQPEAPLRQLYQPEPPRRSLIDIPSKETVNDCKLSPKIGGPGSAFKPYSSSENLYDPSLFPSLGTAVPESTNLLLPPTYPSSVGLMAAPKKQPPVVYNKVKELRRPIRAPFSTTDTEPEMKECHFPPEKNKRTVIKQHPYKPSYSTSETEDEASYLSRKTKWSSRHHQNHHGPKNSSSSSWDPFQVASPPQITQKPVGIIQKPKPQHQYIALGSLEAPAAMIYQPPVVIERGAEINNINSNSTQEHAATSFNSLLSSMTSLPAKPVIVVKQDNPFQSPPRGTETMMKPPHPPQSGDPIVQKTNDLMSNNNIPPPPPLPNGNPFETDQKSIQDPSVIHKDVNGNIPNPFETDQKGRNIIKDANGNNLFEPSRVLRQSSFSNLPPRSLHEALPRQSSFSSVPSIDDSRKISSIVRTEPPPEPSQLKEELEKKLVQRKISSNMMRKQQDDLPSAAVVPLTVVEMSAKKQEEEDTSKKKALHHKLIHEAAASFQKDAEGTVKKKSVLPRNNLTITAMEIMTRKEIKTCEMEERLMREKYGLQQPESLPPQKKQPPAKVVKQSAAPAPTTTQTSHKPPPPTIILKKEPKRLDPEELHARKNSSDKQPSEASEPKREARVISASNVITRSNNGVVEKKKEEYIENLSKSSSAEDIEDSRGAKIKREKVKKAAERFEKTASPVVVEPTEKLPWNDEATPLPGKPKPGILRRRETFRKNGYALRTSKSSDSITASKMMSRNTTTSSGLRINEYNSNGSDSSSDVYHKTRDEIRKILTIAKQSSVSERIKIFNNQILGDVKTADDVDRDRKAEAIKKEILAAKMSAENGGDDLPSRRSSLQIPKRNPSSESRLRINQPPGSDAARQKISRKLSEPSLNGSVQSRIENYYSGAPPLGKKEPKLLLNSHTHAIYAQSATDYSATEEETEIRGNGPTMDYLQVPNSSKKRSGLRRSKSFASSGQYECVLSDEEVDEKTRQMMAFFDATPGSSKPQQQQVRIVSSPSTKPLKGVLKTRQQSISEEILGDEDLGNVDDIFERLLVENAVEDECLRNSGSSGFRVVKNSPSNSSLPPTSSGKRIHYQQQTHHNIHSSAARNQWAAGGGSHEHLSSSPTQSEYESCDPWEDY